jgi:DNA-binding transcriptional regulator GbsR (MarR family)
LIYSNKKQDKGKDSRGYAKIKNLLEPYRKAAENRRKAAIKNKYGKIKNMVMGWEEPSNGSELEDFCEELKKIISDATALF